MTLPLRRVAVRPAGGRFGRRLARIRLARRARSGPHRRGARGVLSAARRRGRGGRRRADAGAGVARCDLRLRSGARHESRRAPPASRQGRAPRRGRGDGGRLRRRPACPSPARLEAPGDRGGRRHALARLQRRCSSGAATGRTRPASPRWRGAARFDVIAVRPAALARRRARCSTSCRCISMLDTRPRGRLPAAHAGRDGRAAPTSAASSSIEVPDEEFESMGPNVLALAPGGRRWRSTATRSRASAWSGGRRRPRLRGGASVAHSATAAPTVPHRARSCAGSYAPRSIGTSTRLPHSVHEPS